MEIEPTHVNDWLCSSRVKTDLGERELLFRARRPDFMPPILAERQGHVAPNVRGAVFTMFELVEISYEECKEQAKDVVEVALDQMSLSYHAKLFEVDIRPLSDPHPDQILPENVVKLDWYRK